VNLCITVRKIEQPNGVKLQSAADHGADNDPCRPIEQAMFGADPSDSRLVAGARDQLDASGAMDPLDGRDASLAANIEPLACDRWLASSVLQKSIRRDDVLNAQRAAMRLLRADRGFVWRRLLGIAFEDIGLGSIRAVLSATSLAARVKGRSVSSAAQSAILSVCSILARAPKDRSADVLLLGALNAPALEPTRRAFRALSLRGRLDVVADGSRPLPQRAVAAWLASGLEVRGEPRIGAGDLNGLLRTYADLGAPASLVEAVGVAARRTREPVTLFQPLLWLEAIKGPTTIVDSCLAQSALVNGIPIVALDMYTRLGQQAIHRLGRDNSLISCFVRDHLPGSRRDGALRLAVFYADGALTRPTRRWAGAAALERLGLAGEFARVNADPAIGDALIGLVRQELSHLNAIRAGLLTRL
jgi:hypothetical protein